MGKIIFKCWWNTIWIFIFVSYQVQPLLHTYLYCISTYAFKWSSNSSPNFIAKARGMTQIAKEAGIGREALYKALRQDSAPRFDTINRVVNALGLKLTVQHA